MEEAFECSLELTRSYITQKIEVTGGDPELDRLLKTLDGAHLHDPIRIIFNRLSADTHRIYRAFPTRKVQLKLEWLNSHPMSPKRPGDFRDPYHIDACTKAQVRDQVASIELKVHLDDFGASSLLAIPALLTHELVCHAHAHEDHSNLRSHWAEGFMDWVAAFFFEQWSPALDLPYALVEERGRDLWLQRMSEPRYIGRAAALALVQWLTTETWVRGAYMAHRIVAKFALEINVAEYPLLVKDELVSRIANIKSDVQLQQAFRAWHARTLSASDMLH